MFDVAVVGSGQCGLLSARMLAEHGARVTLVDRLPAPGGQEPERPLTYDLASQAVSHPGVRLWLGTTAVAWDGRTVRTLGSDGANNVEADVLLIATGTRPKTLAELEITGDRSAGILPGSVALHIIEAGVLPGFQPAIVGNGELATQLADRLLRAGAHHVALIAPGDSVVNPRAGLVVCSGWRVLKALGRPRIQTIVIEQGGHEETLGADALLLAEGRMPMRNVEGAVLPTPGVVFCHSQAEPKAVADAHRVASAAVAEVVRWAERDRTEKVHPK